MLISSGPTVSMFCLGQYNLSNNLTDLFLRKTRLGWVIAGDIIVNHKAKLERCNLTTSSNDNSNLDEELMKFWEIEDIEGNNKLMSQEELEFIKHYDETTTRNDDGLFVVALPFKANKSNIGDTRKKVIKQMFALKKWLDCNPDLKKHYTEVINNI